MAPAPGAVAAATQQAAGQSLENEMLKTKLASLQQAYEQLRTETASNEARVAVGIPGKADAQAEDWTLELRAAEEACEAMKRETAERLEKEDAAWRQKFAELEAATEAEVAVARNLQTELRLEHLESLSCAADLTQPEKAEAGVANGDEINGVPCSVTVAIARLHTFEEEAASETHEAKMARAAVKALEEEAATCAEDGQRRNQDLEEAAAIASQREAATMERLQNVESTAASRAEAVAVRVFGMEAEALSALKAEEAANSHMSFLATRLDEETMAAETATSLVKAVEKEAASAAELAAAESARAESRLEDFQRLLSEAEEAKPVTRFEADATSARHHTDDHEVESLREIERALQQAIKERDDSHTRVTEFVAKLEESEKAQQVLSGMAESARDRIAEAEGAATKAVRETSDVEARRKNDVAEFEQALEVTRREKADALSESEAALARACAIESASQSAQDTAAEQMSNLNLALEEMKARVDAAEMARASAISTAEEANTRLASCERINIALREAIADKEANAEVLQRGLASAELGREVAVDEARKQLDDVMRERDALQVKLNEVEQKLKGVEAAWRSAELDANAYKLKVAELTEVLDQAHQEKANALLESETSRDRALAVEAASRSVQEETMDELSKLGDTVAEMEAMLEAAEDARAAASAVAEASSARAAALESDVGVLRGHVVEQESQSADLAAKLEHAVRAHEEASSAADATAGNVAAHEVTIASLRGEAAESAAAARAATEELEARVAFAQLSRGEAVGKAEAEVARVTEELEARLASAQHLREVAVAEAEAEVARVTQVAAERASQLEAARGAQEEAQSAARAAVRDAAGAIALKQEAETLRAELKRAVEQRQGLQRRLRDRAKEAVAGSALPFQGSFSRGGASGDGGGGGGSMLYLQKIEELELENARLEDQVLSGSALYVPKIQELEAEVAEAQQELQQALDTQRALQQDLATKASVIRELLRRCGFTTTSQKVSLRRLLAGMKFRSKSTTSGVGTTLAADAAMSGGVGNGEDDSTLAVRIVELEQALEKALVELSAGLASGDGESPQQGCAFGS
eukprot:TRINITY_DN20297_c0_g2_i1.p1 TRINITY_DN20297_c0_g2~~TRINITY_DN20297_c0_g2_i1.p1  ORF type:complete len:1147 (-),score=327.59 TRINITY_DN20297_c0_g2_i1:279-3467(-)